MKFQTKLTQKCPGSAHQVRVIVVDDDRNNCFLTTELLRLHNYAVFSLQDGTQLFPALAQVKPDLILLDLKLQGIDGYTLLQQQQSSEFRHIPTIVISAYSEHTHCKPALQLGAVGYVMKSFLCERLIPQIEAAIALPQYCS